MGWWSSRAQLGVCRLGMSVWTLETPFEKWVAVATRAVFYQSKLKMKLELTTAAAKRREKWVRHERGGGHEHGGGTGVSVELCSWSLDTLCVWVLPCPGKVPGDPRRRACHAAKAGATSQMTPLAVACNPSLCPSV